jgi:hypothetical protein
MPAIIKSENARRCCTIRKITSYRILSVGINKELNKINKNTTSGIIKTRDLKNKSQKGLATLYHKL